MSNMEPSIVINEIETEPLSDYVIDFLLSRKKECQFLDFKKTIDTSKSSHFPEIAKDIFAFSNYGGGWILLGYGEYPKNQYVPVGLPNDFQLESAVLQEKFNSFSNEPLSIQYKEFHSNDFPSFSSSKADVKTRLNSISDRFGIIFIPPSSKILKPTKEGSYTKGDKKRVVFNKDEFFYRRGTQSIIPSDYEYSLMKERVTKEQQRISILSGEPDEISERLTSNLFPLTRLPQKIHYAKTAFLDDPTIKETLKQAGVFPEFYYKFKIWGNELVTFEDLTDPKNPYRDLVDVSAIKTASFQNWLNDEDTRRICIELLERELRHYAIGRGFHLFHKKGTLFYPTVGEGRKEEWLSRGKRKSSRAVATLMWAEQLNRKVYLHSAFHPKFLFIDGTIYLRVLPSFIVTSDGKRVLSDSRAGTIITRVSHDKYNAPYLNAVLFWMEKLSQNNPIQIGDYLTIDNKPIELTTDVGIRFDLPNSEFDLEPDGEAESYGDDVW